MNKELSKGEARLLWGIVPADCKKAMVTIHATGRMAEAREEILREAEAGLKRLGPTYNNLAAAWALEFAAKNWLQTHPETLTR